MSPQHAQSTLTQHRPVPPAPSTAAATLLDQAAPLAFTIMSLHTGLWLCSLSLLQTIFHSAVRGQKKLGYFTTLLTTLGSSTSTNLDVKLNQFIFQITMTLKVNSQLLTEAWPSPPGFSSLSAAMVRPAVPGPCDGSFLFSSLPPHYGCTISAQLTFLPGWPCP